VAGLREELDLDVSAALRQVGQVEAALGSAAQSFRVELARALDVLRGGAEVKIDADARDVTRSVDAAVEAADTEAKVVADAKGVTTSIDKAVDAADTDVKLDVDQRPLTQATATTKKLRDEVEKVDKSAGKVSNSFVGVRTAAAGALSAFGTAAVVNGIRSAVDAASDLAESGSKVAVVFGESAPEIQEWATTAATSVGLAKQQALEAAGTFGNLFTALGLSKDAAAQLSPEVVQIAADLASFNNLGVEETLEKLRSGLVGEIEPLRSLGISFGALQVEAKAAELGLRDANGEISEGAKVQARYALILDQTKAAQGDFARTSDGLANQQRILSAEFGNLQAEVGARLLPVMLKATAGVRDFIRIFTSLPEPLQNAILLVGALGLVLGPLILIGGNVSKAITGVGAAVSGLSKLLGVSSLAVGGFGLALAAIAAIGYAYVQVKQNQAEWEEKFNEEQARGLNNAAAVIAAGKTVTQVNKEEADSLAAGTMSLDEYLAGGVRRVNVENDMSEAGRRTSKQLKEAAEVLRTTSAATGVATDRLAELATEMGINLTTATQKQRKELAAAAAELNKAVTPTDRLAAQTKILSAGYATAAEEIEAFDEALDAALGVFLGAEEATIRLRQRTAELGEEYRKGREKGESLQAFQDRLALSTIDLTRTVEDEVAALVRDGRISADAATQKQALISRLNALADQLGGPMADRLREHAKRVATIPDAAITAITADTKPAEAALAALGGKAAALGREAGRQFNAGIVGGVDADRNLVRAAGLRAGQTLYGGTADALQVKSPSRVGMSIGGFFVQGLALGIEGEKVRLNNAALATAGGVADVVREAAKVSQSEALNILQALSSVRDAEAKLAELRKNRKRNALDLRIAELELAEATAEVNRRTLDAIDATEAANEAIERQAEARKKLNDQLDASLGALDALSGVRGAQRRLAEATTELAKAQERATQLPGEIAAADQKLAAAKDKAAQVTAEEALAIIRARQGIVQAEKALADATTDATATSLDREEATAALTVARQRLTQVEAEAVGPTNEVEEAERRLKDLQEEQAEVADRVREATEGVTEAQLNLIGATRDLAVANEGLVGQREKVEEFFRAIAKAAGLSKIEIEKLIEQMRTAEGLAGTVASGGSVSRLINTTTGRPAFTGPNGEPGSASPFPGSAAYRMPDGTIAYYRPGSAPDPGNVGALRQGGQPSPGPTFSAQPVASSVVPITGGVAAELQRLANQNPDNIIIGANGQRVLPTVNIYPKQAVYDPKMTVATLQTLELLQR
jgi:hypothetical protein